MALAPLRRSDLCRVFLRSLWLQASWSFEGMQGLGFAYAVEPALRRLRGEGAGEALGGHLEFFNTQPFLAAAILGCVVRLEEEGDRAGARRVKSVLMGPYGGVGDGLYWGGLKPLTVLTALLAGFHGARWAPWLFLSLFLAGNLGGRAFLFAEGYRRGLGIVELVNRLELMRWTRRLKAASAVLLGAVLAAAAAGSGLVPAGAAGWVWGLVAGILVWILSELYAAGLNPVWAVYGAAALSAAMVALL